MSFRRFMDYGEHERHHVKGTCRWCEAELPPRRAFCGETCRNEFQIRLSPSMARWFVFRRDKGVCASCGIKCDTPNPWRSASKTVKGWAADHIIPVWKGGGECGLDNYQTLCESCHNVKSAAEAAERAAERRPPAEPSPQLALEVTQ